MRNKFFALFVAFAFIANGFGAVFANTKANQANQLAALLPASDGVVTFDVQGILTNAVPQILSGKPQILDKINAHIDEVRTKIGIDLRQFEQVAVGVSTKPAAAGEFDFEPVVLARGKYNMNSLIAVAKIAADGKYREEKVGTRTIYIFSGKEIVVQNKPQTKNSTLDKAIDRMINNLSKEFAVASYDANTLAFGSVARVRETLESKPRIGADIANLINRKPNAVVNFGANLPNGLSKYFTLDNDELGATLDSIRQMAGALEVSNGSTMISLMAKTAKADQAENLLQTLAGLQSLGKNILGGSKNPDKQVYGRMLDNAKITRAASEVSLDLQVPQSDINILLGVK